MDFDGERLPSEICGWYSFHSKYKCRLEDVTMASAIMGVELNLNNAKDMTNAKEEDVDVTKIGNNQAETVSSYACVGRTITIGEANKAIEIDRNIRK